MSLETAPIEEAIESRLDANMAQQIFNSEAPEDAELAIVNGLFKPYLVLYFGGPVRAQGDHHIVSTRHDTTIFYCTVQVNAARYTEARDIKDRVVELLTGFRPPNAGEMILEGGMGYSRNAGSKELPTVYVRETAFTMRANLSFD